MTTRLFFLLLFASGTTFAQALISDRISPSASQGSEPPGYVYSDGRETISDTYYFQIGFRIDSSKFDSDHIGNGCDGWTPTGYWLFDRHPGSYGGRWMVTVGGDGQLCFKDMPAFSWGMQEFAFEFDTQPDTCHMLTAELLSDGTLTVTLDGVSQTAQQWNGEDATYRSGANGIGVAREVNGYHSRGGNDSFPGEIFYLNDNGRVLDFTDSSRLTGSATFGSSVCEGGEPPPPDPEDPCDIDPNSVACACQRDPHPACDACTA